MYLTENQMNRKIVTIIVAVACCCAMRAQDIPFALKASVYGGYILPMTKNLEAVATPPALGGEIAVEFPAMGNYAWQRYWGMPTVGVGFVGMDLGNKAVLGQAFALYPYLLVPIVKRDHFHLNYKIGVGISLFTKTWNRCDTLSGVNAPTANSAIGSILNVYLMTGVNFEFPIKNNVSITADIGYNHMSNGSVLQPNSGLNMLHAQIGAKYTFEQCRHCKKPLPPADRFPYDFSLVFDVSGCVRELYYKDNRRYPVGTVQVSMTANVARWYAIGGALHAFYDGAFVQQGTRDGVSYTQHTHFGRYFIPDENIANKFRAGVAIDNEFIIGRLTTYLQWGVYVYDPLRNANPEPHTKHGYNRPMFYTYDIDKEDGWNYFRLGLRCRVWDNLFVSVNLKTHLQKAEMLTFGIGYQIPFTRIREAGTRQRYIVYHPDKTRQRPENQNQWQPMGGDSSEDPHFSIGR